MYGQKADIWYRGTLVDIQNRDKDKSQVTAPSTNQAVKPLPIWKFQHSFIHCRNSHLTVDINHTKLQQIKHLPL